MTDSASCDSKLEETGILSVSARLAAAHRAAQSENFHEPNKLHVTAADFNGVCLADSSSVFSTTPAGSRPGSCGHSGQGSASGCSTPKVKLSMVCFNSQEFEQAQCGPLRKKQPSGGGVEDSVHDTRFQTSLKLKVDDDMYADYEDHVQAAEPIVSSRANSVEDLHSLTQPVVSDSPARKPAPPVYSNSKLPRGDADGPKSPWSSRGHADSRPASQVPMTVGADGTTTRAVGVMARTVKHCSTKASSATKLSTNRAYTASPPVYSRGQPMHGHKPVAEENSEEGLLRLRMALQDLAGELGIDSQDSQMTSLDSLKMTQAGLDDSSMERKDAMADKDSPVDSSKLWSVTGGPTPEQQTNSTENMSEYPSDLEPSFYSACASEEPSYDFGSVVDS